MVFTVSLSADVQGGVTVNYATAIGTARTDTDSDYTAASVTLTFSGTTLFPYTTLFRSADTKVEADETLTVSLSGVTATAGVPGGTGTLTAGSAGRGAENKNELHSR